MGLDFIRDKKEAFEHQRDAAISRELDTDLLTGAYADDESQLFKCRLTDEGANITPGYRLVLRAYSETEISVTQAGKKIGFVTEPDAFLLVSLMKKNGTHTGIISVSATEQPDILNEFNVRPLKPFKQS